MRIRSVNRPPEAAAATATANYLPLEIHFKAEVPEMKTRKAEGTEKSGGQTFAEIYFKATSQNGIIVKPSHKIL